MTTPRARADVELLENLVLGKLPVAEAERLAVEYADDSRVVELAEAVAGRGDTLVTSLLNHQTIADPNADDLVRRLVVRLKGTAAPVDSANQTCALEAGGASGQPPMPDRLEYFQIQKILGEGGMGTVYLADDTRLQRQVALKTLKRELAVSPGARERFLHEARSAARLEHDHIIPIYYVGESEGIPFLAMPLLQGEPLDARIHRGTPLPLGEAIRIARQIASGLAGAHSRGLIHRDIKPGNIWLESPTGRVKILDFGLVRSQNAETNLTASGAILGTPAYMAPEQARGNAVDHRADLFSLGCVLYEMLTGHRPFTGPDTMAVLLSVTIDTPKAPHEVNPHCPPDLSRLTMQLLEKQPDKRPASAGEVVDALAKMERTADATEVLAMSAMPKTAPKAKPRKRRLLPLVAVGLLLAFIGVFFGGTIYRIATNKGELVIEVDDQDVEIKIVQNGLVVQDKTNKREFTLTAGKGEIEVRERNGIKLATKKFELTRNGKTTVTVTLGELAAARKPQIEPGPAVAGNADRKAAEWVLSIGGRVGVSGQKRWIMAAADLPREPFRLAHVGFMSNQKVSDAGLAHLKDCKHLTSLNLNYTGVSDAGLAHVKDSKNLTHLDLNQTQVSDAGLAVFADCKKLTTLNLNLTKVSDAGLAHLKGCTNLTTLDLSQTQVSDAGLAHLEGCKDLTTLDLTQTQVSDAGLAHLEGCKNLTTLHLRETKVSDAGLAHLENFKNLTDLTLTGTQVRDAGLARLTGCKKLTRLDLSDTEVSDAGLARLQVCKKLTTLNLNFTKVSDAGIEVLAGLTGVTVLDLQDTRISQRGFALLKEAMPKCNIQWSESNRTVAEQVLALGGDVTIGTPGKNDARPVKKAKALPPESFQVRHVSLEGVEDPYSLLVTLSQLRFAEFDRLESIDLSGTKEPQLELLMSVAGLRELSLAGAGLTDESLAEFPKLPTLRRLVLDDNATRWAGLARLRELPELRELSFGGPAITDLFAKNLAGLKKLQKLSLLGAPLTDAGVRHLKALTDLTALDLRKTKVTAAGIEELKKALPKCKIEWDGSVIEPKGK